MFGYKDVNWGINRYPKNPLKNKEGLVFRVKKYD